MRASYVHIKLQEKENDTSAYVENFQARAGGWPETHSRAKVSQEKCLYAYGLASVATGGMKGGRVRLFPRRKVSLIFCFLREGMKNGTTYVAKRRPATRFCVCSTE